MFHILVCYAHFGLIANNARAVTTNEIIHTKSVSILTNKYKTITLGCISEHIIPEQCYHNLGNRIRDTQVAAVAFFSDVVVRVRGCCWCVESNWCVAATAFVYKCSIVVGKCVFIFCAHKFGFRGERAECVRVPWIATLKVIWGEKRVFVSLKQHRNASRRDRAL